MSLGRETKFIPHEVVGIIGKDYTFSPHDKIHNFVYNTNNESEKWISKTTYMIAEFRSEILDAYVRWSLSINGLYKAHEKYSSVDFNALFTVSALRLSKDGTPALEKIVEWDKITASENHLKVTSMMGAWGIIDMFGLLETFIMSLFEVYYLSNPEDLIKGNEFKEIRRLYRAKDSSQEAKEAWDIAIKNRIDKWKYKKIYDGLESVLLSYVTKTNIYETNRVIWDKNVSAFKALKKLRNLLMHGNVTADKEYDDLTSPDYLRGIRFKECENLSVTTEHLQSVELYIHMFLTNLNMGIFEVLINGGKRD